MCTIFRKNTAFSYKKLNCILLENGKHVATNVGEADLIFVLIKNVHLVDINGVPISVAATSKAWVCGHSFAGNVGSNPAGCMNVCHFVIVVCCTGRGL